MEFIAEKRLGYGLRQCTYFCGKNQLVDRLFCGCTVYNVLGSVGNALALALFTSMYAHQCMDEQMLKLERYKCSLTCSVLHLRMGQ